MGLSLVQAAGLLLAGLFAGGLNAIAGGGSFISFPALVFTGIPSVPANATNSVALWPGYLSSAAAYRRELSSLRRTLLTLSASSIVGGLIGALLLLYTSNGLFDKILPFLLLLATLLFAFSKQITAWVRRSRPANAGPGSPLMLFLQLIVSIYGGFFGGGLGIMLLATLSVMGLEDIHQINGLKNLLSTLINSVAVVTFVVAGVVVWIPCLMVMIGAVIGGYGAGALARRLDATVMRRFVLVVAVGMTIFFFYRTYLA